MTKNSGQVHIVFQPSGRNLDVPSGISLLQAAEKAGIAMVQPCGGKGTCGKCRVIVHGGDCPPSKACQDIFSGDQIAMGMRLACQCRIESDCVVEIPPGSLVEQNGNKILTRGSTGPMEVRPPVGKFYFELPKPTYEDGCSDLRRMERALGIPLNPELGALRMLPGFLRKHGFAGTAVIRNGGSLVGLEAGDTTGDCFGVAFDVGTTTIVGTLMDLSDGREVGVAARMNPQISFGDDVISRIQAIREDDRALEKMRAAVIGVVNEIMADLGRQGNIGKDEIYDICLAGNTTMQHIFCGISPQALGEVPFPPAFSRHMTFDAVDMGIEANPAACVYVFPNVGGFVGGDTVAGIISASLDETDVPVVFVDIGTNGEIVLACGGKLLATSTAAGPAFEGARIVNGMRATDGAVEKIWYEDGDLRFNVIGTRGAAGICGTALIDLVASLLDLGVVDITGRIVDEDELPGTVPPAIRARLLAGAGGSQNILLIPAAESTTGEAIMLYQRDVRELQLASGAIRAGISIMVKQAGLSMADIGQVLLAGAFGNYIRRENARRIGLLPDLPTEKIHFVGNAASTGARMALLSHLERDLADKVAAETRHVDLSTDADFQMEFGMAMMFP